MPSNTSPPGGAWVGMDYLPQRHGSSGRHIAGCGPAETWADMPPSAAPPGMAGVSYRTGSLGGGSGVFKTPLLPPHPRLPSSLCSRRTLRAVMPRFASCLACKMGGERGRLAVSPRMRMILYYAHHTRTWDYRLCHYLFGTACRVPLALCLPGDALGSRRRCLPLHAAGRAGCRAPRPPPQPEFVTRAVGTRALASGRYHAGSGTPASAPRHRLLHAAQALPWR